MKFKHLLIINDCYFQDTEAEIEEEVDLLMSRYVFFSKMKCKSMKNNPGRTLHAKNLLDSVEKNSLKNMTDALLVANALTIYGTSGFLATCSHRHGKWYIQDFARQRE